MAYATVQAAIDQFGESEVISLTDRARIGEVDAPVMERALVKASSEIDAYLNKRYIVPLITPGELIATYCCDIARYRLTGSEATMTDDIRDRYKDAIRWLEGVRDGDNNLPSDAECLSTNDEQLTYVIGGDQSFSRPERSGLGRLR